MDHQWREPRNTDWFMAKQTYFMALWRNCCLWLGSISPPSIWFGIWTPETCHPNTKPEEVFAWTSIGYSNFFPSRFLVLTAWFFFSPESHLADNHLLLLFCFCHFLFGLFRLHPAQNPPNLGIFGELWRRILCVNFGSTTSRSKTSTEKSCTTWDA